jgi:HPr Serine kinase C-terminal domain
MRFSSSDSVQRHAHFSRTTDGFLCGWRVQSDLHLPELTSWSGDGRLPDIFIRLGPVPDHLDDLVLDERFLQVDRQGNCLLRVEKVADYLVKASGDEVTISPQSGAAEAEIRVFLLGSVLGYLCHQRRLFPLHASCVAINGKAVALCGASGTGKSTAAIQLALRGHRLVADDVCVIDTHVPGCPRVLPAFPRLKLTENTLLTLNIPCDGLEHDQLEEQNNYHYIAAERFSLAPIPLGGIFLLRTAGPSMLEQCVQLSRSVEKIAALNEEVFRPKVGFALGRTQFLLTAQATVAGSTPIWRLVRHFDFSDMERWLRQIELAVL